MNPQPQIPQAQIDVKQTTPLVCERCQNQTFVEALMFRKVSPLLTKTGQAGLLPIQVMSCTNCGSVPNEFMPKELRETIVSPSKLIS
jgi:uncharacterized Zn finger protein